METATQVKERPILLSGPMIRAILEGRKTMTRRIVKFKPIVYFGRVRNIFTHLFKLVDGPLKEMKCPYGVPGDRLWVRETHAWLNNGDDSGWIYRATDPDWETTEGWKWKPSIFMPRAASRILLEITGVRVGRLQDISEEDAIAEGVECDADPGYWKGYSHPGVHNSAKKSFSSLWRAINGHESWEQNPWVWVILFKRIDP